MSTKSTKSSRSKKTQNGKRETTLGAPSRVLSSFKGGNVTWAKTRGGFMVRRSELVNLLNGSTTFGVESVIAQPGLVNSFPWLSTVANSFERYKFHELSYEIVPNKGTDADGTIYAAFDYDALDSAPADEISIAQASNVIELSVGGSTLPPSSRTLVAFPIPVERRRLAQGVGDLLFTRSGAVSSSDLKTYDAGVLHLAVAGSADTTTVARIRAHYAVEFLEPSPVGVSGVGGALWALSATGSSNSSPFGTEATATGTAPTAIVTWSSTGTTTSVTTFTFTASYRGLYAVVVSGTGLTSFAVSGTSSSVEISELINAGATTLINFGHIIATAGQTMILTIANTTITSATNIRFAQGV